MALLNRLHGSSALLLRTARKPACRSRLAAVTTSATARATTCCALNSFGLPLRPTHPQYDLPSSSRSCTAYSYCDGIIMSNDYKTTTKLDVIQQRQRRWSSSSSVNVTSDSNRDVYTEEQRKQDHRHCVEMVQTRDFEGYLCGLLMPSSAREAFFALRAFNVEIASIKDASQLIGGRARGGSQSPGEKLIDRARGGESHFSENNSMEMEEGGNSTGDPSLASRLRMQWWSDAISEIYETVNNDNDKNASKSNSSQQHDPILRSLTSSRKHNPTLRSLNHAIHTHGLTHRFLRRIMEAREADLEMMQYDRVRDVAQYGEDTVSSVLYLSLECVGVRDEAADEVASDIGVGLGILTALRSTGFRAAQGECSIPSDLASKYSVSMDTLSNSLDASLNPNDVNKTEEVNASMEALRNATREMAGMASFHLHRARDNQSVVPKEGRPCLLPAVCGVQYLDSLKECNYDVLHPALVGGGENATVLEGRRRLGLMFLLGRTWLTGTF